MKNNKLIKISILVLILFMCIGFQYIFSGYMGTKTGTDDQAIALTESIAPEYEVWSSSFWEPETDLGEQLLFTLQTVLAIGLLIFCYYKFTQITRKKQSI